jgi:hypothetical protein
MNGGSSLPSPSPRTAAFNKTALLTRLMDPAGSSVQRHCRTAVTASARTGKLEWQWRELR